MVKKIVIGFLLLLCALVIAAAAAKDFIVRKAVIAGVKTATGLEMSLERMRVGLRSTLVGIEGLKLYNPPGFIDEIMIDLPEAFIDYNLPAFLRRKIHLEEVRLHLREFTVVRNKDGHLNLDALKPVQAAQKPEPEKTPRKKPEAAEKAPEMKIDVLRLKIGKVIYKDYSRGETPKVSEFNVNIDERYENITDPQALGKLIVLKALRSTAIAGLANFDTGALADSLAGSFAGIAGAGEKSPDTAPEAIEKTAQMLKQILPLGGKKE